MKIQPDFEDLLLLLEKHGVKYMIVGGYAVAYHGYPRFTKDLDIFYDRSEQNAANLRAALVEFGMTPSEVETSLFLKKENIVTFGVEPLRVDLVNDIDGVEFSAAWPNRVGGAYGRAVASFIGREDLLKNKTSTQRLRDKADAEELA